MSDGVDMNEAAKALQTALSKLEGSLSSLLSKVSRLEKAEQDGQAFSEDRARLASELDLAKSQNEQHQAREAEFSALAAQTTQELDRVIADVQRALQAGA